MFMDTASVKECMLSLKVKNTESYDRIPQRVLFDGDDILASSFGKLFKKIYEQKAVPAQWLVSKTIPIYKNKGDINDIANYRPISNLCSSSKISRKKTLKKALPALKSLLAVVEGQQETLIHLMIEFKSLFVH